jgi:SNF-related kinase/serine kinase
MLSFDFYSEFFESSPILDNKYKLLHTIGEGRYAKVKLAINMENKKKYAIKIMRENQINSPNKLELFINEVQILASIRSNQTVQIIHANLNGEYMKADGRISKAAYYVMKYAEYGEIYKMLQNSAKFSEKTARYYFQQLIQSVKYLHNMGIGHRDIKTENILIDQNFNLILADFGCACKIRDQAAQKVSFNNKAPVGSPEFNAPEITNVNLHTNYFAEDVDVFACASVLFLMVFKSAPFNCSLSNDPYYSRLCKKDTSSFWKIFEGTGYISPEFKNLIENMMHPQPDKRIKIEEIEKHPWYTGPLPSAEDLNNDMRERAEIILNLNKTEVQTRHQLKLAKLKNLAIQEPELNQRNTSKVESFRNKMQETILQVNVFLEKQKEKRISAKVEGKTKKISEDIGSLNISPQKIEIKDETQVKHLDKISTDAPTKTMGHSMKSMIITKTEIMEPSAHELRQKEENDIDCAYLAQPDSGHIRSKAMIKFSRRTEEDKQGSSGSDSDE